MSHFIKTRISRSEIFGMAQHAGFQLSRHSHAEFDAVIAGYEHFAAQVETREREACAQICDQQQAVERTSHGAARADACAVAIRARTPEVCHTVIPMGPLRVQYDNRPVWEREPQLHPQNPPQKPQHVPTKPPPESLPVEKRLLEKLPECFQEWHKTIEGPDYRPSTDGAAVVAPRFPWKPINQQTPRNCKLQLINRAAGVACYGVLGLNPGHWTHWAPLPTFED